MRKQIKCGTNIFIILFVFIISLLYSKENLQHFKITALADVKSVPLNKSFHVTITVSYLGEPDQYNITDPFVEKYHNLNLLGNSTETAIHRDTENTNKKRISKKYTYILQGESIGQAYFPKALISVKNKEGEIINELSSQAIPISIIKPEKKKNYKPFFITMIVILVISGLGFLTHKIMKIKKQKKEEQKRLKEKEEKRLTPEDEFFIQYKKIKEKKDDEKISYSITILKEYLNKKFNVNIKNKATKEIIKSFKSQNLIKENIINQIEEILNQADLAKFTGNTINSKDIEKIIQNIRAIINSIKGGKKNNEQRD